MNKYATEFTLSITDDDIELGHCIVHIEAKDADEALKKIRTWLSAEIEFGLDAMYEIYEFPEECSELPQRTLVVGRESNVDKMLREMKKGQLLC